MRLHRAKPLSATFLSLRNYGSQHNVDWVVALARRPRVPLCRLQEASAAFSVDARRLVVPASASRTRTRSPLPRPLSSWNHNTLRSMSSTATERTAFAAVIMFIVVCSNGTHAQKPCDQSKFAERPYLPVNITLPETGQSFSAAEIVTKVRCIYKAFSGFYHICLPPPLYIPHYVNILSPQLDDRCSDR